MSGYVVHRWGFLFVHQDLGHYMSSLVHSVDKLHVCIVSVSVNWFHRGSVGPMCERRQRAERHLI